MNFHPDLFVASNSRCFRIDGQVPAAKRERYPGQPRRQARPLGGCRDPRTGVMTQPLAESKLLAHEGRGRASPGLLIRLGGLAG